MASGIPREIYLQKSFDYSKLKKNELRRIMSENGVREIPAASALKSVILEAYKKNIHDRIDYLSSRFSDENIFQEHSTVCSIGSEDEPELSSEEQMAVEDKSNIADKSNITDNFSLLDHQTANSSLLDGSSLIKSASPIKHASTRKPFIKLPRIQEPSRLERSFMQSRLHNNSSLADGPSNSSHVPENASSCSFIRNTKESPSNTTINSSSLSSPDSTGLHRASMKPHWKLCSTGLRLKALLVFPFFIFLYLRFFCPYCASASSFLCVPIPRHTRLEGHKLCPEKGFRIVHSLFITHCVPDNSEKVRQVTKATEIIRLLERLKGERQYGAQTPASLLLGHLTDDKEVVELLKASERVQIDGDRIEALNGRPGFRTILRFYALFLGRILAILLALVIVCKVLLYRRRRNKQLEAEAEGVAKEVLAILNRQLIASTKSSLFKTFVYEVQLRDALDAKQRVWERVRQIVKANSNVKQQADEMGKMTWKWDGPIMYEGN